MGAAGSSTADTLRIRSAGKWVPLGFAREARTVFLVARARSAQWPTDVLRRGVAELELPDGAAVGTPTLVTAPAERERVLALFLSKYGAEGFARWYDHPARVVRVALDGGATAPGPGSDAYYGWLRAEFDNVADDYDRHITGNRMNLLLRNRSLAVLTARFRSSRRLLEIGCGSGMETLPLLEAGHEVTAVDISSRMLATVRAKATRAGVAERLTTRELPARRISELIATDGTAAYDGGYSTYGALNCEPDLTGVPDALARLLPPGGPFVTAVYNRWCLFELLGYGVTFQPRRAFGRARNPVPVGASRFCVDVYAYSVGDFERRFRPRFRLERTEGVPVLLPPSDLTGYADRYARHFDRLARWDARVGRRWPFNRLGDHFLMTFARRP